MALTFDQVRASANGIWKSKIFPSFGIQVPGSKNQHGPCPICARNPTSGVSGKTQGKANNIDRFRCDDQQGNGSWICNVCGAGDGFELVGRARGWSRGEVLKEVGTELGLSAEGKTSDADRQRWRIEAENRRKQAESDELKAKEAAAKKAQTMWSKMNNSDRDCPYIIRKNVQNFGCKVNGKGNLVIPLFDIDGKIWNLQEIHADGYKPFLMGGRVSACFYVIGKINKTDQLIGFAEGYATGASIYEATAIVVVIVFNSGNMDKVAKEFRKKYPQNPFIYFADDDSHSNPPDAGLKAANKAVAATGGIIVLPEFKTVETI